MAKTGVPGVAAAVVHRDRVVFARGFGVRSTKTRKPVKPKTVFQLASVSKPLGASAVAAAVGDGTVRWSDPVVKHLPGFELSDPWVGTHVTIGDLYSHRSGLPGASGNDLESFGFQRPEIIERLKYEPLDPFRISYSYSNHGMTTAGEAVARAAGTTWERFTKERLLSKLRMRHSSFSYADFTKQRGRASLHQQIGGKWVPEVKRNPDPQAPAGGASSTVLDMSRWLRMMLDLGTFDGRRIVAKGPLRDALSLQIRTAARSAAADTIKGYAFGMDVEKDNSGRVRWAHSGAFTDGASTRVLMVPSLDLGLVILTNGWPVGLPEAVGNQFMEIVEYGSVQADWLTIARAGFAAYVTPTYALEGKKRPATPKPARPPAAYIGTYGNDYVGTATVEAEGERLFLRVGPSGKTRIALRHWSGDRFFYNELSMPPGFWTAVDFSGQGSAGETTGMDITEVNSGLGRMARLP